jgi:NAD(P)-dependent dehydrogenase (short-subunit alcohol dehydrogenase family)
LDDVTCVVTGTARGIGRDLADRLAAEGANVALLDVREPEQPLGEGQTYVPADVTDKGQVDSAVGHVVQEHGGVDVLVNAAGLVSDRDSLLNTDAERMHRFFDANAVGALHTVQACHPHLVASQRRGRIINVVSRTFFSGSAGQLAYVASKGALVGMTRVMALEFGGDGIAVNGIMPGQVATPGTRQFSGDEVFAATMNRQAIKEFVTGEHLAGMAAYLASDDGALVTGQMMVCDGGGLLR